MPIYANTFYLDKPAAEILSGFCSQFIPSLPDTLPQKQQVSLNEPDPDFS